MPQRTPKARLLVLLALIVALPILAKVTGLSANLSVAHLREIVANAGAWGAVAFVAVFVGAVVAQVPGVGFILVAPTMFHLLEAWLLCFVASNLAVILNFAVVRKFGGQPFGSLDNPRLRKLFAHLDEHPVRTVALLRVLSLVFPPVTGALALTKLSARDHAVGSALGMALPITGLLLAAGALVQVVP